MSSGIPWSSKDAVSHRPGRAGKDGLHNLGSVFLSFSF